MKDIVTKLCCCAMFAACCMDGAEGMYKRWLGVSYNQGKESYSSCFRTTSINYPEYVKKVYGEFSEQDNKSLMMVNPDGVIEVLNDLLRNLMGRASLVKYVLDNDETIDSEAITELTKCYQNSFEIVNHLIPSLANAFKSAGIKNQVASLGDKSLPVLEQVIEYRSEPHFPMCGFYMDHLACVEKGLYIIGVLKTVSDLISVGQVNCTDEKSKYLNECLERVKQNLESLAKNLRNLKKLPPVKSWMEGTAWWQMSQQRMRERAERERVQKS